MESALIGFLGISVGALITTWITALWQRSNWQREQAMKAYAALFLAGPSELLICEILESGGVCGDNETIEKAEEKLGALVDSKFLTFCSECWLLEKDKDIREVITKMEASYRDYRKYARRCAQEWLLTVAITEEQDKAVEEQDKAKLRALEQKRDRLNKRIEQWSKDEEASNLLSELKTRVANRYFH